MVFISTANFFAQAFLLGGAVLALTGCQERPPVAAATPNGAQLGAQLYAAHCALCHGARLEGQPNWRERLSNGRMPAPPHDETGHTWHHPDAVLFGITKNGLLPPYAPPGYKSDMPAFASRLTDDEIRSVLAFIASHWTSRDVQAARAELASRTQP